MAHRFAVKCLLEEESVSQHMGCGPVWQPTTKHGKNLDKQHQQETGHERAFTTRKPKAKFALCLWNAATARHLTVLGTTHCRRGVAPVDLVW